MVRDYAIMAVANFSDIGEMFEAVIEILLDSGEDIDTRWNAFSFVRSVGNTSRTRDVLNRLHHDPDFGKASDELLGQWQ